MNLAALIGAPELGARLRQATVVGTPAAGVATLRFADQTTASSSTVNGVLVEIGSSSADDIAGVRCLTTDIDDGDAVWVLQQGGVLVALGKVGGGGGGGGGDVVAHEAAVNPHPGYATDADLSTHAATAGHTHPNLATHDALGLATDAELAAHAAAADPHTGYLKETDISGLATPAVVLGTAAAAGTGTTPIRHNSTIAAFDATAPSTQAFADAAAVGSVAFAARRDHKHAMPANPVTAHAAAGDPHPGYVLESAVVHLATFNTPGTLTVVAGKGRFRFPFAATILGVSAAINTAPTGAAVLCDVHKNGTTIFTTQGNRPSVAISGFATTTEPAPDVTAIAAGDYLTVDVDQIGSTIPGADLTVFVRYRPT